MKQHLETINLKEELNKNLAKSSGPHRKKWLEHIVTHDIPLIDLVDILYRDHKTAMKFSWIIGSLCELYPKRVFPIVNEIFNNRSRVIVPNFDRSIAKMFYLIEIPQELEGEAVNIMFEWLMDPKILVSTKNYSLFALYKLTGKYADLKIELKEVIEDQMDKNSADFKKRANKILEKIQ